MFDDLKRPLRPRRFSDRLAALKPPTMVLAGTLVALAYAGLIGWLYTHPGAPPADERIVLPLPPVTETELAPAPPPAPEPEPEIPAEAPVTAPLPEDTTAAAGVKAKLITVDQNGTAAPPPADAIDPNDLPDSGPEVIDLSGAPPARTGPRMSLPGAPLKGLSQEGPDGPLPRIAADGRRPSAAYARPLAPSQKNRRARIALVLGGMGLNADLTAQAITNLPGEVTLAFAPYGPELQTSVNRARADGHEVMLQLPMEPFGYPANNPGPHTLTSENPADNAAHLSWLMSRFQGYFGAVNYLGAKFIADTAAFMPILAELRARGLVYLDDGTIPRTTGDGAAGLARARYNLDAAQGQADQIAAILAEAEREARTGKTVIIAGTGLSPVIGPVGQWLSGLEARGVTLIPVSAAF